jgi:regulator of cell morphogenesis and NO signaling
MSDVPRFADWDMTTLAAYIVEHHHSYVREALPVIKAHTEKVARVHGEGHPEMIEVDRVFADVVAEMTSHMFKEERILFPFIVELDRAAREGGPAPYAPFGSVGNPIRMMEDEHESASGAMARIRELTNAYTTPKTGTTYRVCLQELAAFERDLHTHVHPKTTFCFRRRSVWRSARDIEACDARHMPLFCSTYA